MHDFRNVYLSKIDRLWWIITSDIVIRVVYAGEEAILIWNKGENITTDEGKSTTYLKDVSPDFYNVDFQIK